jgi:hypothetical protein
MSDASAWAYEIIRRGFLSGSTGKRLAAFSFAASSYRRTGVSIKIALKLFHQFGETPAVARALSSSLMLSRCVWTG